MSDNLRRYRAIRDALTQCYPGQPSGTVARHLITRWSSFLFLTVCPVEW